MTCPRCQATNPDTAVTCTSCGQTMVALTGIGKGAVIGARYEIEALLGRGGMGMVFRVHDRVLDETVALKLLRADVASDPDIARRFRQEIKLARRVRHRNVCGIHEYGEDGALRYIAMELIQGVDLRRVLQEKGAPATDEAFEISMQICEGLHAIHEAGIIHRDLKTPNIMRDARGAVRLMDFGIAKQAGGEATLSGTAFGMIVGTPEYMSPEQARGEKIDFRSDIYALGVVIFEIFTGHVPFRGETPIATIFKHLQEPPPLEGEAAAGVPPALVPVLKKALAKTPAERYGDVREVLADLHEARAAATGVAGPTPTLRLAGAVVPRPDTVPAVMPPTPVPTHVPTEVRTVIQPDAVSAAAAAEAARREALERERVEKERLERERLEGERVERARAEQERAEAERAEKDRQERERREAAERERAQRERAERERAERQRAEQERAEQARRQEARKAADEVERLVQAGNFDEADRVLAAARTATGDAEPLPALAGRVQTARRQARERAVEQLLQRATQASGARRYDEALQALRQALELDPQNSRLRTEWNRAEQAQRREREEQQRRASAPPASAPTVAAPAGAPVTPRPVAAAGAAGAAATPARPVSPAVTPDGAGRRKAILLVGAAAAMAVAAVGLWLAVGRGGGGVETPATTLAGTIEPSPPGPAEPSPTSPVLSDATGLLIIDAVPWGEVTEVKDGAGRTQPLPIRYTPVALRLPPGDYEISVRHPGFPKPLTAKAHVEAAAVHTQRLEFQKVDVADYFKKTGW